MLTVSTAPLAWWCDAKGQGSVMSLIQHLQLHRVFSKHRPLGVLCLSTCSLLGWWHGRRSLSSLAGHLLHSGLTGKHSSAEFTAQQSVMLQRRSAEVWSLPLFISCCLNNVTAQLNCLFLCPQSQGLSLHSLTPVLYQTSKDVPPIYTSLH